MDHNQKLLKLMTDKINLNIIFEEFIAIYFYLIRKKKSKFIKIIYIY
jgi:hypothetical protein